MKKDLIAAIIGAGVVGLATGKSLSKNIKKIYIDKKPKKGVYGLEQNLKAVPDIFFICTPTPTIDGFVDISSILESCEYIYSKVSKNKFFIVVVRSTVPIGTNKKIINFFEKNDFIKSKDFEVVSQPEFLREKTSIKDSLNPRLILIGNSNFRMHKFFKKLFSHLTKNIYFTKPEEAEAQKYIHNIFNATKISFFNEMRTVCRAFNLDEKIIFSLVSKSSEASWNQNYGLKDFGAFSGKCLPKDTLGFLNFVKKEKNIDLKILKAVIEVNDSYEKK